MVGSSTQLTFLQATTRIIIKQVFLFPSKIPGVIWHEFEGTHAVPPVSGY